MSKGYECQQIECKAMHIAKYSHKAKEVRLWDEKAAYWRTVYHWRLSEGHMQISVQRRPGVNYVLRIPMDEKVIIRVYREKNQKPPAPVYVIPVIGEVS